jgi:hypothetical protein
MHGEFPAAGYNALLDVYDTDLEMLHSYEGHALYQVDGIDMTQYLQNNTVAGEIQELVLQQHNAKQLVDREVS